MSNNKNVTKIITTIIMLVCLFLVGLFCVVTYFFSINLSLFIGLGLCIVGVLTAHKSVIAEMEFKKYSGPDVISGLGIIAFGILLMDQATLGLVLGCYPITSGIIGLWLLLDGVLALVVKKKKQWLTLALGFIFATLSVYLFASMNFGIINVLLSGITLIAYAVYFTYKELFVKDKDILVEKVQENYD